MNSGYTYCNCRDCMDVTTSSDTTRPELCSECIDAGCDTDGASECAREDAYGDVECDSVPVPSTVEAAIMAITGGRDGAQVRMSLHADTDGAIVWYATRYQWSGMHGYAQGMQGRGPSLRLAVADLHVQQVGAES
jgi:hypothetical protein